MQSLLNKQELDMLQLRIAASPESQRAGLQAQLSELKRAMERDVNRERQLELDHDAEVEALFDNMPV